MERLVGTVSRGIRCPIIREGDDLVKITVDSVLAAAESDGFQLRDRDIIAMTESIVARAQGNYASVDAIAEDVRAKLGGGTVGVIFPILSRNRFAINLRGIARGCKKVQFFKPFYSKELIDKAHANGIKCNMFWSDDPDEAVKFIEMGIDTILTNDYNIVANAVKKQDR